jgi:GntR family transcriptional regulator
MDDQTSLKSGESVPLRISVDKGSAIPYYHQVKEAIKALILTSELKPGDMLPSEFNLSDQLGISRLVIHRAYRELVSDGLLIRQRAKGTFVLPASKRTHTVDGPLFSLTESMTQDGLEPSNKILVQEVINANEEIRKGLRLPPSAKVVHVRSLRFLRDLPLAIEDIFFPYDRFPEMATLDLNNCSTYLTLEKLYDAHPQDALDLISACAATVEDAELLGLQKGAPIMHVIRLSTDLKGLPVEYSIVLFHAEHYQLAVHVHRTV